MKNLRKVAERIADQLFKGGMEREAKRLVMETTHKFDGAGWSKSAAAGLIEDILRREFEAHP